MPQFDVVHLFPTMVGLGCYNICVGFYIAHFNLLGMLEPLRWSGYM